VANDRKVWTLRHMSTGIAVVMPRVEATLAHWKGRGFRGAYWTDEATAGDRRLRALGLPTLGFGYAQVAQRPSHSPSETHLSKRFGWCR
jgi:hypothetical protein